MERLNSLSPSNQESLSVLTFRGRGRALPTPLGMKYMSLLVCPPSACYISGSSIISLGACGGLNTLRTFVILIRKKEWDTLFY